MNITPDQLIKFKEEILDKLKENELKMIDSQLIIRSHVDKKINSFEKRVEEYGFRFSEIHDITINQKEKIDKVNDLVKYKLDSQEQIYSMGLTLKNLESDLKNACSKYDKHYLENLVLPGIIGDFCKYKNMREYIEVLYIFFIFSITCLHYRV